MEHYQLIRKLRRDRHLSQSFLAEGYTTRNAVTKFENRGTNISVESLFWFLEKMNVTLEEYYFIFNNGQITDKKQIIIEGYQHLNTPENLAIYLKKLQQLEWASSDPFYSLIAAEFRSLFYWQQDRLDQDNFLNEDRHTVQAYLDGIDNWGRFELSLFSNLLFLFDDDYIIATFKTTITKMKLYASQVYYQGDVTGFLTNALELFWQRRDYLAMDHVLTELRKLTTTIEYCSGRIACKIFEKIIKHKDEIQLIDLKPELVILEYLDYSGEAKEYRQILEKVNSANVV